MPTTNYNISPTATTGSGTAYGQVPGNIGIPPNIYQGVTDIYSNLPSLTGQAGNVISNEMAGAFSPQDEKAMWDVANSFGVASGMPTTTGSKLWTNKYFGNRLGEMQKRQTQGVSDFGKFLGTLGSTVTDPALAASIASANAVNNAAPDPQLATREQLLQYYQAMRNAQNYTNPGGGTGMYYNPTGEAQSWANQNQIGRDQQLADRQAYNNAYWANQGQGNANTGSTAWDTSWYDDLFNPDVASPFDYGYMTDQDLGYDWESGW